MNEVNARRLHTVLEVLAVLAIVWMLLRLVVGSSYRRYETGTLRYVRAQVQQILSEELMDSELGTRQKLGVQVLLVDLPGGETVEINNYLTETHNILAREGQHVVVCVDAPKNVEPYYTIYNYDRMPGLLGLLVVFLALMLLVGRRKGFDGALAIVFTLVFLLRVTVPVIYNGGSPVGIGFLTVLLSTTVTLLLLNGVTLQCGLGIGVTLLGECAACILFAVFSGVLHLTGFQTDSAEGLLLIAQSTGLQVRTLLFAGTIIASLGAVMDVSVSMLSALQEVAQAAQRPTPAELFRAGMNIGGDMIGTMSNTLIFAFVGGALATMLIFFSYGVQFHQLMNSDYLAVELAQGLCGTAAVILTVPVAAIVGAVAYSKRRNGWKRNHSSQHK